MVIMHGAAGQLLLGAGILTTIRLVYVDYRNQQRVVRIRALLSEGGGGQRCAG